MEYKLSSQKIFKYKAVEHTLNPADLKLFGLNGYLWPCSTGRFGARITNHKVANKHFPMLDYKFNKGEDHLVYTNDISKLVKVLKVPVNQGLQLQLAEAEEKGQTPTLPSCRFA